MIALAYVIAILNPLLMNTEEVEVQLGPLYTLTHDIRTLNIPPDAFKYHSYYRNEHKGVYVSKNLRDFIYTGKGDRDEEGCILTLDFTSTKLGPKSPDPLAYFLHPHDFSDADLRKVDQHIQTLHKSRNMKSIHKLRPRTFNRFS